MATTLRFDRHALVRKVVVRFAGAFVLLPGMLFALAGTWRWPAAWAWTGVMLMSVGLFVAWALRFDPELLERRMETRERETRQAWIVGLGALPAIGLFVLPALDRRFGWSEVPVVVSVLGNLGLVVGYLLFVWVMRTNTWAGRTVRVVASQQVIDVGPYALVRHPMYVSSLVIYVATPIALGSWWGLAAALATVPVFVARVVAEERTLIAELPGYAAYREKVRWRLFPGVW